MRKLDPVEIVSVAIPVLAEFIAVIFMISVAIIITGILAGRI
jgi:hypothetical protein